MGSFDFITFFFLIAAVVIFLQLRSVLGRRTGSERPPFDPYSPRDVAQGPEAKDNGKVVQLPRRETAEDESRYAAIETVAKAGTPLNAQLRAMTDADPNFNPAEFLNGAKMAYEMIVMVGKGDEAGGRAQLEHLPHFRQLECEFARESLENPMAVRPFLDQPETAEADQEFAHAGRPGTDFAGKLELVDLHVAHGGTLVFVSVVKEEIRFSDPEFHKREMTLVASRNATREDFDHVIRSLAAGLVPIEALVTHRTTLEDLVRDLPRWTHDKSGLVKAVVAVSAG